MGDDLSVLLVHDREESFPTLEQSLSNQGMRTRHVRTCSEVRAELRGKCPPGLVLTAITLVDGTWADVLDLASSSGRTTPVIVVSRLVDTDLYLRALDSGAADFIVPPLSAADLAHVVRAAIGRSQYSVAQNGQRPAAP
jgi:DNA-binding NtrC family response regulator